MARALLVALALLVAVPAPAAAQDCQPGAGWAPAVPAPAAEVVQLVNAHRARIGLGPLATSPALTASAIWKARHMPTYGYFGHDDPAPPVARTPVERMRACGYPAEAVTGENIAAGHGSARQAMDGWLASPGHRANIEYAAFRAIGVGVARASDGSHHWVQNFGTVVDAGAVVVPPPAPPPAPPRPPAGPPAALPLPPPHAPAAPADPDARPAARVRGCRRERRTRRAATCRIVVARAPVRVRAKLLRRGRVVARGARRVRADGSVRLRLRGRRALRPGRAVLELRVGRARVRDAVRLRRR